MDLAPVGGGVRVLLEVAVEAPAVVAVGGGYIDDLHAAAAATAAAVVEQLLESHDAGEQERHFAHHERFAGEEGEPHEGHGHHGRRDQLAEEEVRENIFLLHASFCGTNQRNIMPSKSSLQEIFWRKMGIFQLLFFFCGRQVLSQRGAIMLYVRGVLWSFN